MFIRGCRGLSWSPLRFEFVAPLPNHYCQNAAGLWRVAIYLRLIHRSLWLLISSVSAHESRGPTTYKLQGIIIVALNRPYPYLRDRKPSGSPLIHQLPLTLETKRHTTVIVDSTRTSSKTNCIIRTMADPVARTASPYPDKNVKGPRSSQQLHSAVAHSLLQDRKSEFLPTNSPILSSCKKKNRRER